MSTTGMTAMDYIITDEHLVPPSSAAFFTERLWRLHCGFLYQPLMPLPDAVACQRQNAPVTFGSFNRLAKIGPPVAAAWARILTAVPASRLILKTGGPLTPEMIARYSELFAGAGVAADRVEFRGRTSDAEHFRHFQDIDIMLDPFPHGGVLTTCDALAMGVPVVTLAGERILERYGAALLAAAGFDQGIARSVDDYVACATALARERDRLAAERPARSRRMRASPLCDAPGFARAVENAYRMMWRERCTAAGEE
jgi:predicted O-linked N-acetylglucosamine transferase (SPINDLY family)